MTIAKKDTEFLKSEINYILSTKQIKENNIIKINLFRLTTDTTINLLKQLNLDCFYIDCECLKKYNNEKSILNNFIKKESWENAEKCLNNIQLLNDCLNANYLYFRIKGNKKPLTYKQLYKLLSK